MKKTLTTMICAALSVVCSYADTTPHDLSSGNFSQNWTADLISANDDWSSVPSIIGYQGGGLASTDTDPQTVVADGSLTLVDVIEGSSGTSTSGGVHEIETDVIALQGSGTADAPHLVIFLDTTGREDVQISYTLTEEDTSNAVQQFALQYRVGSSGNFTNVGAGYIADASNGAAQTTPVSVILPSAVDDQSVVEVRIITADAGGSDSMIGIDDIVVSSNAIPAPVPGNTINLFQSIPLGVGSGEVVSHAQVGSDYFIAVTDNPNGGVSIYKWVDANQKYVFDRSIDIATEVGVNFDEVSSVALDPRGTGLGAAVAQVDDPLINTTGDLSIPQIGRIVFFDVTDGSIEGQTDTGYHPDMVTFGSTGICAVANEGEYAWDTDAETPLPANNQNGSVSLYDLTGVTVGSFTPAATVSEVNVDFSTATLPAGVRFATVEEIEPEYVSFLASGDALFVGAQENNTLFYLENLSTILTTPASASWEVYPLGFVQYQTDASDKDGIDISDYIKGLHMPDAIAVFEQGGNTYVVTADEGDARPDDSDIKRAGKFAADEDDLVATTPAYDADGPGANGPLSEADFNTLLEDNDELGRIDVLIDQSTVAGELSDIIGLGSRGISVWEYDDSIPSLTRVSHLPLESFLATEDPTRHNANDGGDPGEADKRSDNKGPEPEAVSVVNIGGVNYAVVGCERQNGLVLVDLTDPANPAAVSYINNRDAGLISPETSTIVPAASSPTGANLAILGYEGDDGVTGGIGVYNLEESASFTLTILHNNDGESQLFDYEGDSDFGSIARFKTAVDAHRSFYQSLGQGVVTVFAGDSFLAGPEFQASLESGAPGARTFYDALALSQIGYDALAIGNHELDFGPDVLAEFIGDAQTTNSATYLSANLDFTNEADMLAQVTAGNVATSLIVNVPTGSGVKKVGIIGATTENLPFISSPRDTIINTVVSSVNAEIATLQSNNVDAIILISHLQGLDEDVDLIPSLSAGIDLIVGGGGDELLGNQTAASPRSIYGSSAPASVIDTGLFTSDSFEDVDGDPLTENEYPFISSNTDLGGNTIPLVTGAGNYAYLGRVTLTFDGLGGVTVDSTSNPALIQDTSISATDGYDQDATVISTIAPVQTFVDGLASNIIGHTSVELPQSSNLIRSDERAVGNLVADAYLAKAQALAASFSVDVPQVALVNGGGIRSNIPVGDISELTTFNVSPFGNFVAVVEDITSADFKLLLENAYSRTVDNDPGVPVDPQRQGGGTGRFAQVSGVDVVYDISNTPLALDSVTETISTQGTRVISAILTDGTVVIADGNPVPGVTVDITLPFFNANGGDQYFRFAQGGTSYTSVDYPVVPLIGNTDQQALEDYLVSLATSNTPGDELDADTRYDLTQDGRIVTLSDVDNDRLDDRIEDKLGTDINVADTNNPTDVINVVTNLETAANTAGETAGIATGESNVINDPISFYDEIIAASPTQTQIIRANTVVGLVNNPGAIGGTIDLDIDILSGDSPDNLDTVLDSMTVTGLEAEANKLFYEADAAAGSVTP